METVWLVIAIVAGVAMQFYGFITNNTFRGLFRLSTLTVGFIVFAFFLTPIPRFLGRRTLQLVIFLIPILTSTYIARYLDRKRALKEEQDEEG